LIREWQWSRAFVAEGREGGILQAELKISGDSEYECFLLPRAVMDTVIDAIRDAV
jgi:hypothetical protein